MWAPTSYNESEDENAPTACTGARPTTSMKNGLKNSAPDTPEPIATVEKTMDAGKPHHNCENVHPIPTVAQAEGPL